MEKGSVVSNNVRKGVYLKWRKAKEKVRAFFAKNRQGGYFWILQKVAK